ncbi:hypothetical protein AB1Y20_008792 [Prymnesium parvum]|uniref:Sulfotransferase domain-containing protein n=1 Tax=Prymnesium parvum TaxID=97485 RepID=A0AB34IUB1_PRYPA
MPLDPAARAAAEARALSGVIGRERSDAARFARLLRRAPLLATLVLAPPAPPLAPPPPPAAAPPPPWALHLRLPPYVRGTTPPASTGTLRLHPASPSTRAPVLPTLFMPGFPKSATSWLYGCLLHAFNPEAVGCATRAAGWSDPPCGRRFALTALFTAASGRASSWKETFFFGGRSPDAQFAYRADLLELHGPDPTAGPLAHLPPLWPWEDQLHPHVSYQAFAESLPYGERRGRSTILLHTKALMDRLRTMCGTPALPRVCHADNRSQECQKPRCSVLGTAACEGSNWTPRCRGMGAVQPQPSSGCTHPACARVAAASAAYSGQFTSCSWSPRLQSASGRTEAYCAHSLLPWAREGELNVSVVDFTPNYICDADAMARIHASAAGAPEKMRFILVMRDPIMRAFSEWAMFSLGWNWDPVRNFSASMAYKLSELRSCNASLYMRPDRLLRLPTEELARYVRKCFAYGRATMYATTSMYSVCLLHALRYFKREQFLLLKYEDVMRMESEAVLRLLSRFTGLHLDDGNLRSSAEKCRPSKKNKPNSYSSNSPYAAEMLAEASPHLERFFLPYNQLLQRLVDPSFSWTPKDHQKRALDAAEKAKMIEEQHQYRLFLRKRQVSRRIGEIEKAMEVRQRLGYEESGGAARAARPYKRHVLTGREDASGALGGRHRGGRAALGNGKKGGGWARDATARAVASDVSA